MKRCIISFLIGALLFGSIGALAGAYVANPVSFKVLVNGSEFVSDPPALEVEGRTYLPLRAMGEALGVPVMWNDGLQQAEVGLSPEINEKLKEISSYIVKDIWNDGFVNISWYIQQGTGSTGESLDIDFTLQQLDISMNKMVEYDNYIDNLSGSSYDNIKRIWGKLSPEANKLYKQVKSEKPVAKSQIHDLDTGIFSQYMDAFLDEINKIQ